MKKIALLFSMLFVLALSSQLKAQDYKSAIGVRLGTPLAVTYKFFLNENGAIDAYVGTRYSGLTLGAMYEIHQPIADVEGLKWFVGGGALVSFYSYYSGTNSTSIGINGVGGLDYVFADLPFNISVDVMPAYLFGDGYYSDFQIYFGLSGRYILN